MKRDVSDAPDIESSALLDEFEAKSVLLGTTPLAPSRELDCHDRVRDLLRDAVKSLETARGFRCRSPRAGGVTWKKLATAQWRLVDHFESNGKRYVVAFRDDPEASAAANLSAREREIAARAAMGQSNKVIAYELGVAHSTVRVFVARAAAKLGAVTREEMIVAFLRASTSGDS
jgi:DNA-binding CsgD family transcriptional regulator